MGASWHAALASTDEQGAKEKRVKEGDFDLVIEKEGPRVVWDRIVGKIGKVVAVGEEEELDERSRL